MEVEVRNERMELFPQKALYWPRHQALLVADLHLGKVNHFRKSGIPVPQGANDQNLENLLQLIHLTRPARIICLGDLFHSHYNPEWEVFGELVAHFAHISFELVIGNHDVMSELQYERKGIRVFDSLQLGPFLFSHHPEENSGDFYNMAGHIHPGIGLRGKGRQAMTLPCFYFGSKNALLPAFGLFTGLARINPRKDDRIFVIAENKVLPL